MELRELVKVLERRDPGLARRVLKALADEGVEAPPPPRPEDLPALLRRQAD